MHRRTSPYGYEFPHRITQQYAIPTSGFIQQEQQIKKLTECLLQELDKFHFALFGVIMEERDYDTSIHYASQTQSSELTETEKQCLRISLQIDQ